MRPERQRFRLLDSGFVRGENTEAWNNCEATLPPRLGVVDNGGGRPQAKTLQVETALNMNLHVVTPLWGDSYIDAFLSAILPNHFSEGNLSALPVDARYRIFTTPEDYNRLRRAIPAAEVVAIKTEGTKYDRMIHSHRVAIEAAKHEQAALIFLAPDHVLSTHAITRLLALRPAGYRAVVSPTPEIRLSFERMLEVLQTQSAFTPRELVRVARTCLHSWSEEHFLDLPRFSKYPSSVYWRVGEGILSRHFHLYPLLVDPVRWARPKGTIDGDYVAHAVPDRTKIHVVWDSDELVVFDLAADALCARGRRSWSRTWRAARIAAQCDAHQITYWQQSMYLHADDRGPEWNVVEQETERFAQRVLRRRAVARHLFPLMNRIRRVQQRWERVFRLWRRSLPKVRRKQFTRPVRVTVHRLRKRWRRGYA